MDSAAYERKANKWSTSFKRIKSRPYGRRVTPLVDNKGSALLQKKIEMITSLTVQKKLADLVKPHKKRPQYSGSDDDEESIHSNESDLQPLALWLPKNRSQTCSDLGFAKEDQRPLPSLPPKSTSLIIQNKSISSMSHCSSGSSSSNSLELVNKTNYFKRHAAMQMTRAASKGQIQLKRAATWLGLASQKLLTAPHVQNFGLYVSQKYQYASEHVLMRLTQSDSSNLNTLPFRQEYMDPTGKPPNDTIYGTDSDHCVFIKNQLKLKNSPDKKDKQIINKRKFVAPKRIMYCRVMQIINLASTRDCDYELHIQLNNVTLAIKRGILRKIEKNTSADRPYDEALVFEVQEPFSLNFMVAARHTNTFVRDGLAKLGIWPISNPKEDRNTKLPIAGYICLNFENKMDILDQGVSRFRLAKPVDKTLNRWINIELLIDIKVEEILPAVVHRFPWSYTTSQHSALSYESVEEEATSDPRDIQVSQLHCQKGDYLTIYTRGLGHPTWKRYWVVMEENQLALYDFTFKDTKDPLSIISLLSLMAVAKPSLDDCESVGLSRKTGMILQFNRNSAFLTEFVRLESDEGLEGKAYLYGDHERNTMHWRRALSTYVFDQSRTAIDSEDGIDLRFLW